MAIEMVLIGSTELVLRPKDIMRGKGKFPEAYRGKNMPLAQYLEDNDSLIWLFEAFYRLQEIIQFLKEHPRPAHREKYPRVEVYNDDTYWGEGGNKNPLRVLKDVNLLELLEALKEFAPEFAR
ncbi:MAG: hypothetical protein PHW74_07245 [Desulfobacca sp.]|nr:hypothetical protein [Desulfobacca sp.]